MTPDPIECPKHIQENILLIDFQVKLHDMYRVQLELQQQKLLKAAGFAGDETEKKTPRSSRSSRCVYEYLFINIYECFAKLGSI